MIESFVQDEKGDLYLNSLRRFVQGGISVPSQPNSIVKVGVAQSIQLPRSSRPFTLEAPQDADSSIRQLVGVQGLAAVDTGTISSAGGVNVTGVGTLFTTELQPGDTIVAGGQTVTILSITDDLHLTLVAPGFVPDVAGVPFVNFTPVDPKESLRLCIAMQDSAYRRPFQNRLTGTPVNHVFGTARKPGITREEIWQEQNNSIICNLYNFSTTKPASFGASTDVRKWQIEALQYQEVHDEVVRHRERKPFFTPFWFSLDDLFVTCTPGGTNTGFMTATGDATLILWDLMGHGIQGAGAGGDTTEGALVELIDGETGRTYQSQPLTINTALGDASDPFRLSAPIIIKPRNQLKVRFTSLITIANIDCFATVAGVAVYNAPYGGGVLDPAILKEAGKIWDATKPTYINPSSHARN